MHSYQIINFINSSLRQQGVAESTTSYNISEARRDPGGGFTIGCLETRKVGKWAAP
jgi:hypothetical protein